MKLFRIMLIAILVSFLAMAAVSAEDESDGSIYVRINTFPCHIDFEDNEAAGTLYEKLQGHEKNIITLTLEDKGGYAKVGRFLFLMPSDDEYINASLGDLVLDGDNLLLIYEPHAGNYTRLGKLHDPFYDDIHELLDNHTSISFSLQPFS